MIPNAAPADRRFMTAAVSGITMLRNTAISSRKLSTTTTPMNSGSLRDRTVLKSSKIAVCPPVSTCKPVPRSEAGTTCPRTVWSRSAVEASCGAPLG
jgi:hypothetical protein